MHKSIKPIDVLREHFDDVCAETRQLLADIKCGDETKYASVHAAVSKMQEFSDAYDTLAAQTVAAKLPPDLT